jgi:hypothetical protein
MAYFVPSFQGKPQEGLLPLSLLSSYVEDGAFLLEYTDNQPSNLWTYKSLTLNRENVHLYGAVIYSPFADCDAFRKSPLAYGVRFYTNIQDVVIDRPVKAAIYNAEFDFNNLFQLAQKLQATQQKIPILGVYKKENDIFYAHNPLLDFVNYFQFPLDLITVQDKKVFQITLGE